MHRIFICLVLCISAVQTQRASAGVISGVSIHDFSSEYVYSGGSHAANYLIDMTDFDGTAHGANRNQIGFWTTDDGQWAAEGAWVIFDLGATYDLNSVHIWNYNVPQFVSRGAKELTIESSLDATNFTLEKTITDLTPAPPANGYLGDGFGVQFNARYVRMTIVENHGDTDFAGLSQVQFSTASTSPVPEPSSFILLFTACIGLIGLRLRRHRQRTLADKTLSATV